MSGPEYALRLREVEAENAKLRGELDRAVETLRLTRDGASLLVGAEEERQAKLREACGGSEPSGGHDYADEVIGLLRVTRQQRDDAGARAASVERERARLAADTAAARTQIERLGIEVEALSRERHERGEAHRSALIRAQATESRERAARAESSRLSREVEALASEFDRRASLTTAELSRV